MCAAVQRGGTGLGHQQWLQQEDFDELAFKYQGVCLCVCFCFVCVQVNEK